MLIKKNQNEWKSFDWRLHWEKCGEIFFSPKFFVFLRSLYCHFEKNPIFLRKMSFREKSYFFRKRQDFLMIFPRTTEQQYMCYYQNVNNEDSFRSVLHWEKCGEILFFSKILCFLGKCEENLVYLKKFSIFLKSLYSHFEKMWRKYCPFLQN